MMLILEIRGPHGDVRHHAIKAGAPFTIGRAYTNDLILTDPHIGLHHARITETPLGWNLEDLNTINGTQVNGVAYKGRSARIGSGDTLHFGQTTLRVFAPDHPLADPVKVHKSHPVVDTLFRPRGALLLFMLAIAAMMGWSYLEIWSEEPDLALAGTVAGTLGVIFLWAGIWSVASRLITHRSAFSGHIALVSLYLLLSVVTSYLINAVDFVLHENIFALIITYMLNATLLWFLVYGGLSLSTHLKKRRRMTIAFCLAGGIAAGLFAVGMILGEKFDPYPAYPSRLEPYLARLAPADTPAAFIKRAGDVFESNGFERE